MADSKIILTCKYIDRDYAARNEFDFACTNPVFIGFTNYNPLLFDDIDEFCADCPIYDILRNVKKELAKQHVRSVIHG